MEGMSGRAPGSLRGEEGGGRQADGDMGVQGEDTGLQVAAPSGTLTPDDRGGPGWAGHSSAQWGQSAGCDASSKRYLILYEHQYRKMWCDFKEDR